MGGEGNGVWSAPLPYHGIQGSEDGPNGNSSSGHGSGGNGLGGHGSGSSPERPKMRIPRQSGTSILHPVRNHRRHVNRACDPCRQKKTKCTGELSGCRNCLENKNKCGYTDGKREKTKKHFAEISRNAKVKDMLIRLMVECFDLPTEGMSQLEEQAARIIDETPSDEEVGAKGEVGDGKEMRTLSESPVRATGGFEGDGTLGAPRYIGEPFLQVNCGHKHEDEEDKKPFEASSNSVISTSSETSNHNLLVAGSNPQIGLNDTLSTVVNIDSGSIFGRILSTDSGHTSQGTFGDYLSYTPSGTQFDDSFFQGDNFLTSMSYESQEQLP